MKSTIERLIRVCLVSHGSPRTGRYIFLRRQMELFRQFYSKDNAKNIPLNVHNKVTLLLFGRSQHWVAVINSRN